MVRNEHTVELPADVPPRRAALVPNLETAVNAVWDAELHSGERVVIVGAGAIGTLLAYAVHRLHDVNATVIDTNPERAALADARPWVGTALDPVDLEAAAFDVAFHASGSPDGLQVALDAVGFEGRVLELSWYGEHPVTLDLGTSFHYQRKRIIASQVAAVAPSMRATTSPTERLAVVIGLLDDPGLDALLGDPVPFSAMPQLMAGIYRGEATAPVPLIHYAATAP